SAAAPRVIRTRLSGSGVRSCQLTTSGPCGATKDPAIMHTRTPVAIPASSAKGCARRRHRARVRVLTALHGSRAWADRVRARTPGRSAPGDACGSWERSGRSRDEAVVAQELLDLLDR